MQNPAYVSPKTSHQIASGCRCGFVAFPFPGCPPPILIYTLPVVIPVYDGCYFKDVFQRIRPAQHICYPLISLGLNALNLNKSLIAQLHLINTARPNDWDILVLQEPWISHTGTRSFPHWRVLYPNTHFTDNTKIQRSLIFVNTNIPTNSYEQVQFDNADVMGIRIAHGTQMTILINVYNDCNQNKSVDSVGEFLEREFPNDHVPDDINIILTGDFNRHHAWWEDDRNVHPISSEASLQPLLDLIYRYDFRMALPPG